ncbi:MAG: hypothetical protein AAGH81_19520, partial [Bacteroidota bacterium]
GAIALNHLKELIGKEKFNRIVLEFVNSNPERPKVFVDLYQSLLQEIPVSKKAVIRQLFETTEALEEL